LYSTHRPRWAAIIGDNPASDPVVANGFVYVSSYGGKLFAFDATAGNPRWAAVVTSGSASDPAMANGIVYISSRKGELHAFDAFTGKLRWAVSTNGGSVYFLLTVAYGIV
jgi:outer membrane protein assembly factor BamB